MKISGRTVYARPLSSIGAVGVVRYGHGDGGRSVAAVGRVRRVRDVGVGRKHEKRDHVSRFSCLRQ